MADLVKDTLSRAHKYRFAQVRHEKMMERQKREEARSKWVGGSFSGGGPSKKGVIGAPHASKQCRLPAPLPPSKSASHPLGVTRSPFHELRPS